MTNKTNFREFENFFVGMSPAQQNSDEAFVWYSGVPHPMFNAVMHLKTKDNLETVIDKLISEVPEGNPFSIWSHELNGQNNLKEVLLAKGFEPIATTPFMTWDVRPTALGNHSVELTTADTFQSILGLTFHVNEIIQKGYARLLEQSNAENFVVFLEGKPVGTGSMMINGKTGGIFNISTLSEYQKKGCARSMMLYLMNRAVELGLEKLVLTSSSEGFKLYSDLGFTNCFDIEIFAK